MGDRALGTWLYRGVATATRNGQLVLALNGRWIVLLHEREVQDLCMPLNVAVTLAS